jgi:hypothetical protein
MVNYSLQQEKEGKMRKLRSIIVIPIFMAMLFAMGCSDSNVSAVKEGVLKFDKSLTVGQAFDNYKYFDNVDWESFTTENGREVVQVTGNIDLDKYPLGKEIKAQDVENMQFVFQFLILKDGESFQFHTVALRMKSNDGTEKQLDAKQLGLNQFQVMRSIKQVYDNEPIT